jgi:hypothetical protein
MLNFKEDDHRKLHELIRQMLNALEREKEGNRDFIATHPEVLALSREILKREWDRVREKIRES